MTDPFAPQNRRRQPAPLLTPAEEARLLEIAAHGIEIDDHEDGPLDPERAAGLFEKLRDEGDL